MMHYLMSCSSLLQLGVDDFMARVEVALSGYGLTGDNSIGKTDWGIPPRG